jgi:hypothetical protein
LKEIIQQLVDEAGAKKKEAKKELINKKKN